MGKYGLGNASLRRLCLNKAVIADLFRNLLQTKGLRVKPVMTKIGLWLFILMGFSVSVFGQNGLKDGRYFLLLKDSNTISVNIFENNEIKEIKTYPISEKFLFTTDQKQRVAILDTNNNSIGLYNILSSQKLKQLIPFNIKSNTILLDTDNLFIGGIGGLARYHIQSDKWYQIESPDTIYNLFKPIDGDSLLINFNNKLTPKYKLHYYLISTEQLNFSSLSELKSDGKYKNSTGEVALNLISETLCKGYEGTFDMKKWWRWIPNASPHLLISNIEFIIIYYDLDLTNSFAIIIEGLKEGSLLPFNDFLLIKNNVFFAHKENGLGMCKIENYLFSEIDDGEDWSYRKIRIVPIIYKQYGNKEIIHLTKIPNEDTKIILTLRDKAGKIRYEAVETK